MVGWLSVPVVYYTTEEKENCAYSHRCGDSTASRYIYSRRGFFRKKVYSPSTQICCAPPVFLIFSKNVSTVFSFPHTVSPYTHQNSFERGTLITVKFKTRSISYLAEDVRFAFSSFGNFCEQFSGSGWQPRISPPPK